MATIHDFARICNYYEHCDDCPFSINGYACGNYLAECPNEATEKIDKWIAEHPIKTYASNLYDKFPNAQKNSKGYPIMCLNNVYGDYGCPYDGIQNTDGDCCEECWNREYKGE